MRSSLAKSGPVWVGQRVTIKVELLTTTFFAGAPVFQLPAIPQALLMQIEDHPVLGTEQVDDTTYNVQQHELALFMLRPGGYTVPPFTVRFASAPRYGEPPVEHRLTTPAIQVEARMPPGAEHLPSLISTRELHVTQTWQPQPTQARLGDAFTRTITLMAPDVPGMVFPPLPLAKVDGLAVYPKPPVVQDQVERGTFTGQRTQTVTYVCEHPGLVTLPALIIPWWDVEHQKLQQVTLPALTLQVVAPSRGWPWWTVAAGLVLAACVLVAKSRTVVMLENARSWRGVPLVSVRSQAKSISPSSVAASGAIIIVPPVNLLLLKLRKRQGRRSNSLSPATRTGNGRRFSCASPRKIDAQYPICPELLNRRCRRILTSAENPTLSRLM